VNPEPASTTLLPTIPVEGPYVSAGVTVNVATAVTGPSSGVDAATLYEPAAEGGTITVHVNERSPATTTVPSLHEELVSPKDGVTVSPGVNPEPVKTTSLPTIPLEGPNVNPGGSLGGCTAAVKPERLVPAAGGDGEAEETTTTLELPTMTVKL
jgi:hypothetical protein